MGTARQAVQQELRHVWRWLRHHMVAVGALLALLGLYFGVCMPRASHAADTLVVKAIAVFSERTPPDRVVYERTIHTAAVVRHVQDFLNGTPYRDPNAVFNGCVSWGGNLGGKDYWYQYDFSFTWHGLLLQHITAS